MKKGAVVILTSAVILLSGCSDIQKREITVNEAVTTAETTAYTSETTTSSETAASSVTTEAPAQEYTSVSVICAGDNLIHPPIYKQAKARTEDGTYDFTYAYENVAEYIDNADLAILNQETILSNEFEPSNYPSFCTPTAMGDYMVSLGFDAVSISNNHVLDKGEKGLLSTLSYWEDSHPDIPVYGAYKNAEDMNNIRTSEVNGIVFSFLGYMEHTNGLYLNSDSECELTYLSETDIIKEQIEKAREISDCVVVSLHFGVEITNIVTDYQRETAKMLSDWGADIIIGTQPHTIQTMEFLEREDGNRSFVFYCLGNLISAQDVARSMVGMLGGITVEKNMLTGEISLKSPYAVPIINHYDSGYRNIRLYPFSEYTKELGNAHGCSGTSYNFFEQLIEENIPAEFLRE